MRSTFPSKSSNVRVIGVVCFAILAASVWDLNRLSASPIFVRDDLGRKIVLPCRPQRIVSLEPSVTEELYAVGAGGKLVADDYYADFPAQAKYMPHVNGMLPSREMIVGLHPDLIVLFDQTFTAYKADQWSQQYGVPVYVTNAGTYVGVEHDIANIGGLLGTATDTMRTISVMNHTLQAVRKAVAHKSRPKVFVTIWDKPLMTAGSGTFMNDLIDIAGGVNVAAVRVTGYPAYSPEQLVADDPDIIISGTTGTAILRKSDPGLSMLTLRADRYNRTWAIPDDWTARPGPRLALGLSAMARILHPDAFR